MKVGLIYLQLKCLPFSQDELCSQLFVCYEICGSREDRTRGTGVIWKMCYCRLSKQRMLLQKINIPVCKYVLVECV